MEHQIIPVIGLPRALLYHRYGVLWRTFFSELGIQTVLSPQTNREIMENGASLITDESCLSAKVFFGHVQALLGACDYILVPRISNYGRLPNFCVRFEALYDMRRNVFRHTGQKFLSYDLNALSGWEEDSAFMNMGQTLGCSAKQVKKAYKAAKKEEQHTWKLRVQAQEQVYKSDGIKILIAAHSYLIEDVYLGGSLVNILKSLNTVPVRADLVDRDAARNRCLELLPTCKWEVNQELVGGILQHRDQVDGIILLSAFPCGPDAMVNEMLLRTCKGIPMLNLVLDSQVGTAGMETRLESFVDIIRFKEGKL